LCVLMRPLAAAQHSSPAELRIALSVVPREQKQERKQGQEQGQGQLELRLIKRRGLAPGKTIRLATRALPCLGAQRKPRLIPSAPSKTAQPSMPWLQGFGLKTTGVSVRERSLVMDR
jgi:hypothetical protein